MRIDRPSLDAHPLAPANPDDGRARLDPRALPVESLTLRPTDHLELAPPVARPDVQLDAHARLEQLLHAGHAQQAPAPSLAAFGPGWSPSVAPRGEPASLFRTQHTALDQIARLRGSLQQVKADYHDWKLKNPTAPEPSDGQYTMGQIVDGNLSDAEQCLRLLLLLIHERPQTMNELQQALPSMPASGALPSSPASGSLPSSPASGAMPSPATSSPAPSAPATQAAGQNPLGGLLQAIGPIAQVVGPVAQILGGVLASPLGAGILTAAFGALGAVFPPALPLVALAPVIAPIAGMSLMGLGSVANGVAGLAKNQQQPGAPAAPAPAALPAAPDLSGAVNGISGLLNAVGPVVSAAAPIATAIAV